MKNDYLWDGHGSDQEIEQLEQALLAFRYSESDPPELPATNIIEFGHREPRRRFAFIFALSAGVLLLGAIGLTWRLVTNPTNKQEGLQAAIKPEVTAEPAVKTAETKTNSINASQNQKAIADVKAVNAVQIGKPSLKKPLIASARMQKEPVVRLTSEEKYAYRQLLLALSITGSKLKQVHETIDRIEEKKNTDK